ncbi:MAG: hypothetical protein ACW7DR_11430 [Paraglaciecola chathamensis]
MPIKQANVYQVLLTKPLNDKDFVNEALSLLESSLWEMSLLALQDWANTKIPSPDLFHSIAALQQPSWGVWNGVLNDLRKVRTKVIYAADKEHRQKIDQAVIIKRVLERLDSPIKAPETEVWFTTSNVCREPRVIGFQSVTLG